MPRWIKFWFIHNDNNPINIFIASTSLLVNLLDNIKDDPISVKIKEVINANSIAIKLEIRFLDV